MYETVKALSNGHPLEVDLWGDETTIQKIIQEFIPSRGFFTGLKRPDKPSFKSLIFTSMQFISVQPELLLKDTFSGILLELQPQRNKWQNAYPKKWLLLPQMYNDTSELIVEILSKHIHEDNPSPLEKIIIRIPEKAEDKLWMKVDCIYTDNEDYGIAYGHYISRIGNNKYLLLSSELGV